MRETPDFAWLHPGYGNVVHHTLCRRASLTEVKTANHHPVTKDAAGDGVDPPPAG
jgi:hypothetical protein